MIHADFATRRNIRKVILDKEIYDRIGDDNSPPREEFKIPIDGGNFIGGYVDNKIASLFVVHGKKMHFMVLKDFREHARELLQASFMLWPRDVYIEVPTLYRSVINFAKNFGFKEGDVKKNAHLKNGKLYDCQRLTYEVKNGIC